MGTSNLRKFHVIKKIRKRTGWTPIWSVIIRVIKRGVEVRFVNTVSDTCTAFAIFEKLLIPGSPNFARHQLKG